MEILTAGSDDNQQLVLSATWPAPERIKTLITTRNGGVSIAPFSSLNLAYHVGDDDQAVEQNRLLLQQQIAKPLVYLNQVHGTTVVKAQDAIKKLIKADAIVDNSGEFACAIMTADCLPVLFCNRSATVVAAAHAGWRGLQAGILQQTIKAMTSPADEIMAYLGPAISADAFEVGQEVVDAFLATGLAGMEACFLPLEQNQYLADIYQIARLILASAGVKQVFGGDYCTVIDRDKFFSYRREGQTGRMVSAIWMA